MEVWLSKIYLSPQSQLYQMICFFQKKRFLLSLVILLLIIIYPCIQFYYDYHQSNMLNRKLIQLDEDEMRQKRLLQGLLSQQQNQQKEHQFIEINQKIKDIIKQYNINVESIQWQFEKGRQVYLTLNQESQPIFEVIFALNQMEELQFTQLVLLKLNQHRLIQLNAELILN